MSTAFRENVLLQMSRTTLGERRRLVDASTGESSGTGQFWTVPFPDTQIELEYLPPTTERAVARTHSMRQGGQRTSSHLRISCECRVVLVCIQGRTSGRTARIYPASMGRLSSFLRSGVQVVIIVEKHLSDDSNTYLCVARFATRE